MILSSQKGFSQLLAVLILTVGIIGAVVLIKNPQIFKSKADNGAVTVTVASGGQSISPLIWGRNLISPRRDKSLDQLYSDFASHGMSKEDIKAQGIKLLRFGAFDWKNCSTICADQIIQISQDIGAEPLAIIDMNAPSRGCGEVCFPSYSSSDEDEIQYAKDFVQKYGPKIKYYELANEPYLYGDWDPNVYANLAPRFRDAIKSIRPDAVVGVVHSNWGHEGWNGMVRNISSGFDWVDGHDYPKGHLDIVGNPHGDYSNKPLGETEWNLGCGDGTDGQGYNKVPHGIFAANNLLKMAKDGELLSNFFQYYATEGDNRECGIVDQGPGDYGKRPADLAFTLTSVLAGGKILDTNSSGGDIIAYSGLSPDSQNLYVFLLNKNGGQSQDIKLDFLDQPGFQSSTNITVKTLAATSPDDSNYNVTESSFSNTNATFTVPPVSIVRVKLSLAPGSNPITTTDTTSSSPSLAPAEFPQGYNPNHPDTCAPSPLPSPSLSPQPSLAFWSISYTGGNNSPSPAPSGSASSTKQASSNPIARFFEWLGTIIRVNF